ncbi:hypothetical protein LCGC14_1212120 [marine sediment metagenome]|uniref:Uncharacterized protein n=1 Tax=marine sediment metagenome TaxID=412755 RepID=A0A0F9M144_9ZZZZ
MDRFEDTPGLFGSGAGIGTSANVSCDWCGAKYEGREREDGEPLEDNVSIGLANFGGLEICDCCFERWRTPSSPGWVTSSPGSPGH